MRKKNTENHFKTTSDLLAYQTTSGLGVIASCCRNNFRTNAWINLHISVTVYVTYIQVRDITTKRFEGKYLLLSGFTLEVVQISPANIL